MSRKGKLLGLYLYYAHWNDWLGQSSLQRHWWAQVAPQEHSGLNTSSFALCWVIHWQLSRVWSLQFFADIDCLRSRSCTSWCSTGSSGRQPPELAFAERFQCDHSRLARLYSLAYFVMIHVRSAVHKFIHRLGEAWWFLADLQWPRLGNRALFTARSWTFLYQRLIVATSCFI